MSGTGLVISDMEKLTFRTLSADEIECRPATIKDGKAVILLYIDSRAVVRLLNETVGAMNWTMDFEEVNGQLVGKLGIWDKEKSIWVYKCDTGSESNIEAQKGLFSDCYKRCLSRWGVDELYTAPRIVIDDDGYGCSGYRVSQIEYNDSREIISLVIVNRFGKEAYRYSQATIQPAPAKPQNRPVAETEDLDWTPEPTKDNLTILRNFCKEKMKVEPEWKEDIIRFGKFYSEKLGKGWNGQFKVDTLYGNWCSKRKAA